MLLEIFSSSLNRLWSGPLLKSSFSQYFELKFNPYNLNHSSNSKLKLNKNVIHVKPIM